MVGKVASVWPRPGIGAIEGWFAFFIRPTTSKSQKGTKQKIDLVVASCLLYCIVKELAYQFGFPWRKRKYVEEKLIGNE
jgi:hypothetical protein